VGLSALEPGQQFLGRRKGKVVQEDDDVLFIPFPVGRGADDKWRGKQVLLLKRVRVHPVRAAGTDREGIAHDLACLD